MLAIIDYGAGNLQSVAKALKHIGCDSILTNDVNVIKSAGSVILPGVGSFKDAMDAIRAKGLDRAIKNFIDCGKPFLGICLGLQLLFEYSDESPGTKGLSVFKGGCRKIPNLNGQKVPHIGWNSLNIKQKNGIFNNFNHNPYVYFVHSYFLESEDRSIVAATAEYGIEFDAAIEKDNLFAAQFHPEKSGETGIQILRNFINR